MHAGRLILQDIRQRLMDAPPIREAGALRDRRANERMPEAKRLQIEVDDAGLGGRHSGVEIQAVSRRRRGRLEGSRRVAPRR